MTWRPRDASPFQSAWYDAVVQALSRAGYDVAPGNPTAGPFAFGVDDYVIDTLDAAGWRRRCPADPHAAAAVRRPGHDPGGGPRARRCHAHGAIPRRPARGRGARPRGGRPLGGVRGAPRARRRRLLRCDCDRHRSLARPRVLSPGPCRAHPSVGVEQGQTGSRQGARVGPSPGTGRRARPTPPGRRPARSTRSRQWSSRATRSASSRLHPDEHELLTAVAATASTQRVGQVGPLVVGRRAIRSAGVAGRPRRHRLGERHRQPGLTPHRLDVGAARDPEETLRAQHAVPARWQLREPLRMERPTMPVHERGDAVLLGLGGVVAVEFAHPGAGERGLVGVEEVRVEDGPRSGRRRARQFRRTARRVQDCERGLDSREVVDVDQVGLGDDDHVGELDLVDQQIDDGAIVVVVPGDAELGEFLGVPRSRSRKARRRRR